MRNMYKKLLFIILSVFLTYCTVSHAEDTGIRPLDLFTSTSSPFSAITTRVSGKNLYFPLSSATTSIINTVSTTATSSFANGIRLSNGCFQLPDGSCAGTGSGGGVGTSTNPFIATYFVATGTAATSSFANGISLSSGCFAIGGICLTTTNIPEGSNLYYTLSRWASALAGTTTDALAEGSNNLYWTNSRFDTRLSATTSLPKLGTLSGLVSFGSSTATTTALGDLSVTRILKLGTGTTTGVNGIDLSGGCFAQSGICLPTSTTTAVGGTGAVQFANGTAFNGDNTQFFYNNTSNNLYMGTTSDPFGFLQNNVIIHSPSIADVILQSHGSLGSGFIGYGAGGTPSTPATTTSGTIMSYLAGAGFDGTAYQTAAHGAFGVVAAEDFSTSSGATYLTFRTTPIGSNAEQEYMRLDSNGLLGLGTGAETSRLHIQEVTSSTSPFRVSFGTGGLNGFTLQRTIAWNNTSGQVVSNYTATTSINTSSLISAGKMQSNCADMRFVDVDNSTQLQYKIVGGCNTASTIVYIKKPLMTTGSQNITFFYGNPSASDAQVSSSTLFALFDDFTGSSVDATKWTVTGTTNLVSGSMWHATTTSSKLTSVLSFNPNIIVEATYRKVTDATDGVTAIGFRKNNNRHVSYLDKSGGDQYSNDTVYASAGGDITSAVGTTTVAFSATNSSAIGFYAQRQDTGAYVVNPTYFTESSAFSGYSVVLGTRADGANTGETMDAYWDSVTVRTFVSPVPVLTVGAESAAMQTTSAFYISPSPGYVGVHADTAPGASLDVHGIYGEATHPIFQVSSTTNAGETSSTSLMVVQPSGNVGIGTTSPYALLSVVGEIVGAKFTATTTGVANQSTFQNFVFTNSTGTSATTTNLAITGLVSTLLKTNANGSVIPAVAGTDYQSPLTLPLSTSNGGTGTSTWTTNDIPFFNGTRFTSNPAKFVWDNVLGALGIGTSTPKWMLDIASSTAPQLALSDGIASDVHWTFRNNGGNLFVATASPSTFATSTVSAITLTSATATFATPLVTGGSGTSTFSTGGINLTGGGCFAIAGTCVIGPSSGISGLVQFSDGAGGFSSNSNFNWNNSAQSLGIGTSTQTATLQVTASSSNATTTVEEGKSGQNKGTCDVKYQANGSVLYVYYTGNAPVYTTTSCK